MPETSPLEEDYYLSDTWKAKRKFILERDDSECRLCGSSMGLQVHHKTYERFGGEELETDLITLCEKCHTLATLVNRHQSWIRGNPGNNNINEGSSVLLHKLLAEVGYNNYKHEREGMVVSLSASNGQIQPTNAKAPSKEAMKCAEQWYQFRPESPSQLVPLPSVLRTGALKLDDGIIPKYMRTWGISREDAFLLLKGFITELSEMKECSIKLIGGLATSLCEKERDLVYQRLVESGEIPKRGAKEEVDKEEVEVDATEDLQDPTPIRSGINTIRKIFSATSEEVEVDDYTLNLSKAAGVLSLGQPQVRELIEKGELKTRRTGPIEYVSEASIGKYLKVRPLSTRSVMSILDIPKKNDFYALCIAGRLKNVRDEGRSNYAVLGNRKGYVAMALMTQDSWLSYDT